MKFCVNCGSPLDGKEKFCEKCGCPLQSGKSKSRFWIIAVFVLVIAILGGAGAIYLIKNADRFAGARRDSQAYVCEVCEEIDSLQMEMAELAAEYDVMAGHMDRGEYEAVDMKKYQQTIAKISSISNEIRALGEHECSQPVQQVENRQYVYDSYVGFYSGGWKAGMPYGEGDFMGEYKTGGERLLLSYIGEWSGGIPQGEGFMFTFRGSMLANMPENWHAEMFQGYFENGRLCGRGWSNYENCKGIRYEYFDGDYKDGFLQGQAYYVQYKDGEIYDEGIVEGQDCIVIYSKRQEMEEILRKAEITVAAVVGLVVLYKLIKKEIGSHHTSAAYEQVSNKFGADCSESEETKRREAEEQERKAFYNKLADENWKEKQKYEVGSREYNDYEWKERRASAIADGSYSALVTGFDLYEGYYYK